MYMYYEGIKEKKHMICTNFIRIKNSGLDGWNVTEHTGKHKSVRT